MPKSLLLDEVRKVIRLLHYSIRTEEAYVQTIRRFILYHHKRHPREMGVDEIRQYLSHLATDGNVAASTQNVALCALLFLYRQVLRIDLPFIESIERAKRPKRVPVVFTPAEVRRVLARLHGTHQTKASLLYGAGLRLMECVRLRMIYTHVLNKGGKGVKSPLEL
jgi:site-specific recombinase XerD